MSDDLKDELTQILGNHSEDWSDDVNELLASDVATSGRNVLKIEEKREKVALNLEKDASEAGMQGKTTMSHNNMQWPQNSPAMPEEVKPSTKWLWFLVALPLAFVACLVTVLVVLKPWENFGFGRPPVSSTDGDGNEGGGSSGILPLSLDDERVKKLIGYFDEISLGTGLIQVDSDNLKPLVADFYVVDGVDVDDLSNLAMINLALANLRIDNWQEAAGKTACRSPSDEEYLLNRYTISSLAGSDLDKNSDEYRERLQHAREVYQSGCLSGDTVRSKIREIFGREADLSVFERTMIAGYDKEYDEFYPLLFENENENGYGEVIRVTEKAETDGERIYIDQIVALKSYDDGDMINVYAISCPMFEAGCKPRYENVGQMSADETAVYLRSRSNAFGRLRLVFKRSEVGNYVFERIEELQT